MSSLYSDQNQSLIKLFNKQSHDIFQSLKFLHFKSFKCGLLIALIFCCSGLYNYYFIQNHIFALNNMINVHCQYFNQSSNTLKDFTPYIFNVPKYGKWQDSEHLIVRSPIRNIQTIRTVGFYRPNLLSINTERPFNRIFKKPCVKQIIDQDTALDDYNFAQRSDMKQDSFGDYVIMGTTNKYRSYKFVNIYPINKKFVYHDTIDQVKKRVNRNFTKFSDMTTTILPHNKAILYFYIGNGEDHNLIDVYEILNTKTKQVEMAQFGSETYVSHYLFDKTKFPTYTLYANNQNLSNRYVNNLFKHFHKQTQTD